MSPNNVKAFLGRKTHLVSWMFCLVFQLQYKKLLGPRSKRSLVNYLPHVHFNNRREVGSWLVVAKEGTLECPLIQEIHRVGFEGIILIWHTNEYSYTPSLNKFIMTLQWVSKSQKCHIQAGKEKLKDRSSLRNYIVNAFECRSHGIDVPCALNTSVDSSISHFSDHLGIEIKIRPRAMFSVCDSQHMVLTDSH